MKLALPDYGSDQSFLNNAALLSSWDFSQIAEFFESESLRQHYTLWFFSTFKTTSIVLEDLNEFTYILPENNNFIGTDKVQTFHFPNLFFIKQFIQNLTSHEN